MEDLLKSVPVLGESILLYVVFAALPLVFVLVYALVTVWLEMKISAHIQDRLAYMRTGWHGVAQPLADILKLIQKENTVPATADRFLHALAPYLIFAGTYGAIAAIPFSSAYIGSNINLGVFYIIAVSSIVVVGILMAGWASNNKWSLFGALRSAAQMISYEIPTAMAILVAVMITQSLNLQDISILQEGGIQDWVLFGGSLPLLKKFLILPFTLLAFLMLIIAGIAEVNRTPFDLPEAESELVQGYMTEYSGMKFAMFYLAEYANMFIVAGVASALYLGGWASPFGSFLSGPIWGFFWFVAKGMTIVFLQIWIRWTLPRLRVDQLMYTAWKVMIPFLFLCIFAVGFILVW